MSVKIYSLPTCPACKATKIFLKEKGVSFEDVNVYDNKGAQEEMTKKSGGNSVPVLDIDGKIIVGFNQDEIEEALK